MATKLKKAEAPSILKVVTDRPVCLGISTAFEYLQVIEKCLDGSGVCPRALSGASKTAWAGAIKASKQKLVYTTAGMDVVDHWSTKETDLLADAFSKNDIPDLSCGLVDCITTSTRRDRDGDVMESSGAIIDPQGPFLQHHNPWEAVGKHIRVISKSKSRLMERNALVDNDMGNDALLMVEFGAYRISHGFEPLEWEPLDPADPYAGFHIKSFEIRERSLVYIPSNTDAVVIAHSRARERMKSAFTKAFSKALFDKRPAQGIGIDLGHKCSCQNEPEAEPDEKGFCPTGAGGGVDNSCGSSEGGGGDSTGSSADSQLDQFGNSTRRPAYESIDTGTKTVTFKNGSIKLKQPSSIDEGNEMLSAMDRVCDAAAKDADDKSLAKPHKLRAEMVLDHSLKQLARAIGMVKKLVPPSKYAKDSGEAELLKLINKLAEKYGVEIGDPDGPEHELSEGKEKAKPSIERWRKSDGPAFDVEAEVLQASTELYRLVKRFLNCEMKHVHQEGCFVPSFRMGSFLTSLQTTIGPHKQVDLRNINHQGTESPPEYSTIQLNSTKSGEFLVEGIQFRQTADSERFIVHYQKNWSGLEISWYAKRGQHELIRKAFDAAWELARGANNFLRGESFTLSGDFIPKTDDTWAGLFLDPVNESALKRAVEIMNTKGSEAANRGMLLMGPPGTGKTLSGRVIRNTAKATFIWLSARDFYYSGGFGGLAQGFDLAKECSPSVLFIEDVDNWLFGEQIDLLKTEMDGIGRYKGVLTVLTTNFPERLPEALIDRPGRFHDVLKFDLPDETLRATMLKAWLPGLDGLEVAELAKQTDDMSGAHLYELAAFARTIEEQESKGITRAAEAALAKVIEQRELISQSHSASHTFRPTRGLAKSVLKCATAHGYTAPNWVYHTTDTKETAAMATKDKAKMCSKCGGKLDETGTCFDCGYIEVKADGEKPDLDTQEGCEAAGGKWAFGKCIIKKAAPATEEACDAAGGKWAFGKCVMPEKADDEADDAPANESDCDKAGGKWLFGRCVIPKGNPDEPKKSTKAGRALSAKNQSSIQDARDDCLEVAGMDVTRSAKSLAAGAARKLDEVLKAVQGDRDDTEKSDPILDLKNAIDRSVARAVETGEVAPLLEAAMQLKAAAKAAQNIA